jgi:hypothetical protein
MIENMAQKWASQGIGRIFGPYGIGDGFRIAHSEGWTRDRWDKTVEQYEATKFEIRRAELMDGKELEI